MNKGNVYESRGHKDLLGIVLVGIDSLYQAVGHQDNSRAQSITQRLIQRIVQHNKYQWRIYNGRNNTIGTTLEDI